jgi:hypothetical protein
MDVIATIMEATAHEPLLFLCTYGSENRLSGINCHSVDDIVK